MKLLTEDNETFLMETLPKDEPLTVKPNREGYIYYCVLDLGGEPDTYDFSWERLEFWEDYEASGMCLEFGFFNKEGWQIQHTLLMPIDWSIMIKGGEPGTLEMINLKELNDRAFEIPVFNPHTTDSFIFNAGLSVRCSHAFRSVPWTFPQLHRGHILVIPLEKMHNPPCVFMCLETGSLPQLTEKGAKSVHGFYVKDILT